MAQDKVQLRHLLNFIDELAKPENGNEWFVNELRKRFGNNIETSEEKETEDQKMIKHYLCLEYLNENIPGTEKYAWVRNKVYEFVDNDYIKESLYADWHEMIRHRFGTRMHMQSFEESCRYAAIQMERLLNYYFLKTGGSHEGAVKKIAEAPNPKVDTKKTHRIEDVTWSFKLFSFDIYAKKIEKAFNKSTYETIAYVRNNASHGSTESLKQKLKNIELEIPNMESLLSISFPKSIDDIENKTEKNRVVSAMGKMNVEDDKKYETLKNRIIDYKGTRKTYSFYMNKNFDEIIIPLQNFIELVKRMISKGV